MLLKQLPPRNPAPKLHGTRPDNNWRDEGAKVISVAWPLRPPRSGPETSMDHTNNVASYNWTDETIEQRIYFDEIPSDIWVVNGGHRLKKGRTTLLPGVSELLQTCEVEPPPPLACSTSSWKHKAWGGTGDMGNPFPSTLRLPPIRPGMIAEDADEEDHQGQLCMETKTRRCSSSPWASTLIPSSAHVDRYADHDREGQPGEKRRSPVLRQNEKEKRRARKRPRRESLTDRYPTPSSPFMPVSSPLPSAGPRPSVPSDRMGMGRSPLPKSESRTKKEKENTTIVDGVMHLAPLKVAVVRREEQPFGSDVDLVVVPSSSPVVGLDDGRCTPSAPTLSRAVDLRLGSPQKPTTTTQKQQQQQLHHQSCRPQAGPQHHQTQLHPAPREEEWKFVAAGPAISVLASASDVLFQHDEDLHRDREDCHTTHQQNASRCATGSPGRATGTRRKMENCHHCKTKKEKWVRCGRVRTHRYCDRCVERHFMMRFEAAESLEDRDLLWITGCPICEGTCPCASCSRRRGKNCAVSSSVETLAADPTEDYAFKREWYSPQVDIASKMERLRKRTEGDDSRTPF